MTYPSAIDFILTASNDQKIHILDLLIQNRNTRSIKKIT